MKKLYITGIGGFLGREIATQAIARGIEVHGLLLPNEPDEYLPPEAHRYRGDVTKPDTLAAFLREAQGAGLIHCAGVISIVDRPDPLLNQVNVQGTANLLDAARIAGVGKMVYVSSVHAIPEKPHGETISEVARFDPDEVHGAYAKSKAAASALAMDAARGGMAVSLVHPSGIIGPDDWGVGHTTTMLLLAMAGKLPAIPPGGYDFVDVRDVASGTLAALEKGQAGCSYLLTGHHATIRQLMELLHQLDGAIHVPMGIPMWVAKAAASVGGTVRSLRKKKPLFTLYSLYTLQSNSAFIHQRAQAELGYAPRPLKDTLTDMVRWGRVFLEKTSG